MPRRARGRAVQPGHMGDIRGQASGSGARVRWIRTRRWSRMPALTWNGRTHDASDLPHSPGFDPRDRERRNRWRLLLARDHGVVLRSPGREVSGLPDDPCRFLHRCGRDSRRRHSVRLLRLVLSLAAASRMGDRPGGAHRPCLERVGRLALHPVRRATAGSGDLWRSDALGRSAGHVWLQDGVGQRRVAGLVRALRHARGNGRGEMPAGCLGGS